MWIYNKSLRSFLILSIIGLIMLPSGAVESGNPTLYHAYRGLEEFGVEDAWDMGYTGEGVKVAVMDSGVDFATPDLIGTQARVSNASSPTMAGPLLSTWIRYLSIISKVQETLSSRAVMRTPPQ